MPITGQKNGNNVSDFLLTEERVYAALREVIDPELGINIVDLGLIYGVEIDNGSVQ
ncbi:MAG: DUF59 domain-containing protein, partial [Chloroflexi bacterium]|nr:DUF59 domain-containing protein [Chloroflexota bacterium]